MVKLKESILAKLPKKQRSRFIVGPMITWFRPNATDMWSPPDSPNVEVLAENGFKVSQDDMMDCDQHIREDHASLSYFIYGSMGCFCYGEIYHHHRPSDDFSDVQEYGPQADGSNSMSAAVSRLIDVKGDKSKVSCVRFLKASTRPLAMVLTESGTLLIHDCLSEENLVLYRKKELMNKFVDVSMRQEETSEHLDKKPKISTSSSSSSVSQQINSCLWPNAQHALLGISLVREKTNLLIWLKLKDLNATFGDAHAITKESLIESHEKLNLDLNSECYSTINCMEFTHLSSDTCLIAVADERVICVLELNFNHGQAKRIIKLKGHSNEICSMSLFFDNNNNKFPLGLLSSVARDGQVLLWDLVNEFKFAYYELKPDGSRSNSKTNWFSLDFITSKEDKQVSLAVSNTENGLTVLDVPLYPTSRPISLKDHKYKKRRPGTEQSIRHQALLFNVIFNPTTRTVFTSSFDSSHILWSLQNKTLPKTHGKKDEINLFDVKPQYLLPSMPSNSRTHMLRHSPIREDLLGMALGEAGIRLYRVAKSSRNHRFDMNSSSWLIAHKITKSSLCPTSLSWHPSHEYRLAIGTIEGKVLRADLTPRKASLVECEHKPVLRSRFVDTKDSTKTVPLFEAAGDILDVEYEPLERQEETNRVNFNNGTPIGQQQQQHLKSDGVYSICWGPNPTCPGESWDGSRLAIYAVGSVSHRLFIYTSKSETNDKLTNYLDECLDQSLPEAIGEAAEVAWKSSLDLMALGTTTGKIIIASYDPDTNSASSSERGGDNLFKKIAVIQGQFGGAAIQCLAWHPTTDRKDEHYYLIAASARESSEVYIFSISSAEMLVADVRDKFRIEDSELSESKESISPMATSTSRMTIMSTYLHKLEAHKKPVSDIAWNPHKLGDLATSSFDGQCYVWSLDLLASASSESVGLTLSCDDSAFNVTAPPTSSTTTTNFRLQGRIKSKFSARDRLFTVEWSLVDSDLIFTSGHDSVVWAWRPSENPIDAPAAM